MKNTMKKLVVLLGVMVMALAMSVTAFAADSALTIKTAAGHTYKVYQLLVGDVDASSLSAGSGTLSNVKAGNSLQLGTKTVEGETVAETLDDFIAAVKAESDSDLGDTAWSYVKDETKPDYTVVGAADNTETTETDESAVSVTVPNGYYVVEDTASDGTIISRYMVAVVGATTMEPKNTSTPTVEKKVKDINDSTETTASDWQDSADYDIGDTIPYKLTATLPTDYDQYHTYYLSFNDTLSAGLTLNASSIVVKVGDTTLTNQYYIYGTQNSFKVVIYDLKTVAPTATKDTKVTVEYTAVLNENAKIGSEGNDNTVTLTYTTNPNTTTDSTDYPKPGGSDTPEDTTDDDTPGTPSTPTGDNPDKPGNEGKTPDEPSNPGTTTPDKNVVFTYELDANKIKADKSALTGAAFELQKLDAATGTYKTVSIQNATYDATTEKYTIKDATVTSFSWKGLDDGTYKIVEVVTPAGYNTLAPQIFTVAATHDTTSDDPQLTSLTATTDSSSDIEVTVASTTTTNEETDVETTTYSGKMATSIVNQAGNTLPSTGGIGTTIFYIVGACLVVFAGVLLISKRRMAR